MSHRPSTGSDIRRQSVLESDTLRSTRCYPNPDPISLITWPVSGFIWATWLHSELFQQPPPPWNPSCQCRTELGQTGLFLPFLICSEPLPKVLLHPDVHSAAAQTCIFKYSTLIQKETPRPVRERLLSNSHTNSKRIPKSKSQRWPAENHFMTSYWIMNLTDADLPDFFQISMYTWKETMCPDGSLSPLRAKLGLIALRILFSLLSEVDFHTYFEFPLIFLVSKVLLLNPYSTFTQDTVLSMSTGPSSPHRAFISLSSF